MATVPQVVVVGGANLDTIARAGSTGLVTGSSVPGTIVRAVGGVGRNIAAEIARNQIRVELVSVVGNDSAGDLVLDDLEELGVGSRHVARRADVATGQYVAVLDDEGEMQVAIAETAAAEQLAPSDLPFELLRLAPWVVVDANLSAATIGAIVELARGNVIVDAVSIPKARRARAAIAGCWLVTANAEEITAMGGASGLLADVEHVWLRQGRAGSTWHSSDDVTLYPAAEAAEIVDVTGAGDAAVGALVAALAHGQTTDDAVTAAHRVAATRLSLFGA